MKSEPLRGASAAPDSFRLQVAQGLVKQLHKVFESKYVTGKQVCRSILQLLLVGSSVFCGVYAASVWQIQQLVQRLVDRLAQQRQSAGATVGDFDDTDLTRKASWHGLPDTISTRTTPTPS